MNMIVYGKDGKLSYAVMEVNAEEVILIKSALERLTDSELLAKQMINDFERFKSVEVE